MFSYVKKRGGEFERFHNEKIHQSIKKAMHAAGHHDVSTDIEKKVLTALSKAPKISPSTYYIHNLIEEILLEEGLKTVAKHYSLYKTKEHHREDVLKHYFGKQEHLDLSPNAVCVLQKRYLRRDTKGNIAESPDQLFTRVAKHIASAEKRKDQLKWEEIFYHSLKHLDFLPNTPCLVNAGTPLGQMAACFVLDVPDSLEGIYESLKQSALIFQSGAGVGYSFSNLRHEGSIIHSTGRPASGPVSFMKVFDSSCEAIKQGGIRRGANMGVLRVDHPDIFEFITEKSRGGLQNFNVSVSVTDEFMKAVIHNKEYWLQDHSGKKTHNMNAREVFDFLCGHTWECGDPGLLFIDEINRKHPLRKLGKIETSNPCGEAMLLENESCTLGSVNLAHMVHGEKIDWPKLAKTVALGVRFLDNVVTLNKYPTKDIEAMCLANRKIGLGVMGWADMLLSLKIKYDSEKALHLAKEIMKFIRKHAEETSEKLAKEKGAFPNYKKSTLKKQRRNATVLSIAPTGSISLIASCVVGETLIHTIDGKKKIKDLVGTEPYVYSSGKDSIEIKKAYSIRKTRDKAEIWKIKFDTDDELILTPDHLIMLSDGNWKRTDELKIGESIRAFEKHIHVHKKTGLATFTLYMTNLPRKYEHIAILEAKIGRKLNKNEIVHHIDENRLNNKRDNLQLMTNIEHARLHSKDTIVNWSKKNKGKTLIEIFGEEKAAQININKSLKMKGENNWKYGARLSSEEKQLISERTKEAMARPEVRKRFLEAVEKRSNNEIWLNKIRDRNRRDFSGKVPWNKGLNKDTDERVKKYGEKISKVKTHNKNHKVISIGFYGYEDVYNMEVEDTKNYVANGVIVHNCSSGIEPLFAVSYVREAFGGVNLFEFNQQFEQSARYRGFYSSGLLQKIAKRGSVQGMKEVPKDIQTLFVTALDIPLEWHVKMQAAFQTEVDNAVSKTINLPQDASIGDVKRAYMLAWKEKCKGITVYRYGSKEKQVLYLGEHLQEEHTKVHAEYSGGCIGRECHF